MSENSLSEQNKNKICKKKALFWNENNFFCRILECKFLKTFLIAQEDMTAQQQQQ